jgi:hypothetical protein
MNLSSSIKDDGGKRLFEVLTLPFALFSSMIELSVILVGSINFQKCVLA